MTGWEWSGRARARARFWNATLALLGRYAGDELNIAEGAGEFASDEKTRFYRIARRSATESAAIFDACRVVSLTTEPSSQAGRAILLRIVAMLTAMVKKSGSGSGSGST